MSVLREKILTKSLNGFNNIYQTYSTFKEQDSFPAPHKYVSVLAKSAEKTSPSVYVHETVESELKMLEDKISVLAKTLRAPITLKSNNTVGKVPQNTIRELRLKYDEIKKELVQERLKKNSLIKKIMSYENQWSARKQAFGDLVRAKQELKALKLEFEKSEKVRKKQKQVICELTAKLTTTH